MNRRGGAGFQLCQLLMCCPLVCGLLTDASIWFYSPQACLLQLPTPSKEDHTNAHGAFFSTRPPSSVFLPRSPPLFLLPPRPSRSGQDSERLRESERRREREREISLSGVDSPLCLFFSPLNYCLVFKNCPPSPPHIYTPRSMWEP